MHGQGFRWGVVLGAVMAGSAMAGGCVDLFHSTDFGTVEAGAEAGHPDATHDATKDTGVDGGKVDGKADGKADGTTPHDAGQDAKAEASSDGGVRDAPHDTTPGPTDFCAWTLAEAQEHTRYACDWLGACEGPTELGQYEYCYAFGLLAYDCAAYPEGRVTGLVHEFWDALWQAKSCDDVNKAVFPQAVPTCTMAGNGCLPMGDAGPNVITVRCAEVGAVPTGSNCAAAGLTCVKGACVSGALTCGMPPMDATAPTVAEAGCQGTFFQACEYASGTTIQISQDCQYFGGGACHVLDGGFGGCLPGDAGSSLVALGAGDPCTPSLIATCNGSRYVTACPTGTLQLVDCAAYGGQCSLPDGSVVASNQPETACFVMSGGTPGCDGGTLIAYPSGFGAVVSSCIDAGLGACSTEAGAPACSPPP